jgi:hypothetical protein
MHCKEICSKYKVKKSNQKQVGRNESGHKRCSFCVVYLNLYQVKNDAVFISQVDLIFYTMDILCIPLEI